MSPLRLAVPLTVAALAAASLLLPFAPLYDVWAWLVWGREITGLDLDTGAGPSWKPLPVVFATAFAPAGDAAPELWLVVARMGWLASIALAWRLASRLVLGGGLRIRLAGALAPDRVSRARIAAGAIAALGMVLLHDAFTSWMRQFAGGLSEPLLVALVLGAVDRHLSGRRDQAFALAVAAALLRPESWPFLIVYGWWLWTRSPQLRRLVVGGALAVVVLWFGVDLLGSGNPFTGVERAQEGTGWPPHEALEAIGRAFDMVLAGLWVAAALRRLDRPAARRARDRRPGRRSAGLDRGGGRARRGRLRGHPPVRGTRRGDRLCPRRGRRRQAGRASGRHEENRPAPARACCRLCGARGGADRPGGDPRDGHPRRSPRGGGLRRRGRGPVRGRRRGR